MRWLGMAAAVALLVACSPAPAPTPSPSPGCSGAASGASEARPTCPPCQVRGQLPDPACTPGVANPAVTQDDINTTICVTGWTATIRPPLSYTEDLKRKGMLAYGFTDSIRDHEEDHLVPLELGGHPSDPRNLWPEPGASPNPKDGVENQLRALVCSGQVALTRAQQAIASNWTTAVATVKISPTP